LISTRRWRVGAAVWSLIQDGGPDGVLDGQLAVARALLGRGGVDQVADLDNKLVEFVA
jgi:hypothetical protein